MRVNPVQIMFTPILFPSSAHHPVDHERLTTGFALPKMLLFGLALLGPLEQVMSQTPCAFIAPHWEGNLSYPPALTVTPPVIPGCQAQVDLAICSTVGGAFSLVNTTTGATADAGYMNGCSGGHGCANGCMYDGWLISPGHYELRIQDTEAVVCATIPFDVPESAPGQEILLSLGESQLTNALC